MGVLISYSVKDFTIKKANLEDVRRTMCGLASGRWTDKMLDVSSATIDEIFSAWRWKILYGANGDLVGLEFLGEKVGNDDLMFEALAPFVETGATILASHDYGEDFVKFVDGKLRTGNGGPIQYVINNIHLPKSNQDAAADLIRTIPPDFWFDRIDTAAMSFHELLQAWRWKPTYDLDGNLTELSYLGEGTANELQVIEALGRFALKGASVKYSTNYCEKHCVFDGKEAKWVDYVYKGA